MIILSAGMQKSGSAYFYNVINELLIEAGNTDARQIKVKYGLNDLMKWPNAWTATRHAARVMRGLG